MAISSFQSEWGYLYASKDFDLEAVVRSGSTLFEKATQMLPHDVSIVDPIGLQRFFLIPIHYTRK